MDILTILTFVVVALFAAIHFLEQQSWWNNNNHVPTQDEINSNPVYWHPADQDRLASSKPTTTQYEDDTPDAVKAFYTNHSHNEQYHS